MTNDCNGHDRMMAISKRRTVRGLTSGLTVAY